MENERRLAGRITFNEVAELYDRIRPGYPDELFDDLFSLGRLAADANALEIGPGTGQATRSLLSRTSSVLGVELGANMATQLRSNLKDFPGLRVANADFERWDSDGEQFDLIFASSAWHWIDPSMKYSKGLNLLQPGGVLAIVTGEHAFPEGFDPFFTEIQPTYDRIGEGMKRWPPPPPEEVPDLRTEIEESGLFKVEAVRRYLVERKLTASEFVDLLETFSGHLLMDREKRDILYAEARRLLGDRRVTKHQLSILHVARPLS